MTVKNRMTAPQIRQAMENAIVEGRFAPGDKLDLEKLEAEFACSRTPIREALQALEVSGLVRIEPKRGSFVTRLDVVELTERFEVMAELEAMSARLAATRAGADDIWRIRETLAGCETAAETGNSDEYYHQNTYFHHAIYAASGNRFLEAEARRMQTMLQPYRRRQVQLRGRMMRSLHEHRRIVQMIEAGDAERAATEMNAHVVIQGERFHELVAALRLDPV
ncbi:DNA-binding transcriptional regulator, GntR family [Paracoccus isoporae]|uniref:DNA-binding transcriptional regulator, GntR family n=1 Tax=Paracoccus isoporae TaxID=591205 RepID=A0A1G6U563_9RHOB|nr:GntR family transcriptional regulator [Paracoccus isoporae]SDD36421.1 DNA-binding transcriptional regulator, GntR family [Paracoccus isoporae]